MKVSLKKCEKLLCNNIHFYLSTPDKYKFKEVHKSAINQTLRIRLFFRDFCGFQATSQKNLKGFLREEQTSFLRWFAVNIGWFVDKKWFSIMPHLFVFFL